MKSICEIAALITLLSITAVTTAFADGDSVTVTNNTSYTLTQVYASPSSSSAWDTSSNLLAGGLTVLPGAQLLIPVLGGNGNGGGGESDDSCQYDLMGVLYGATQHAYTYSVNICDGGGSWTITGM